MGNLECRELLRALPFAIHRLKNSSVDFCLFLSNFMRNLKWHQLTSPFPSPFPIFANNHLGSDRD